MGSAPELAYPEVMSSHRRSDGNRHIAITAFAAIVLVACGERPSGSDDTEALFASARDTDAGVPVREYGRVTAIDGVSFDRPVGAGLTVTGPFDPTLLQDLEVALVSIDARGERTLARFDARTSPALVLFRSYEVYFVDVPAAPHFTDPAADYQLRVLLAGRELGRSELPDEIHEALRQAPTLRVGVKVRIEARAAPAITALEPAELVVGAPATLTIHGSGFVRDSVVRAGGDVLATSFVSPTMLTAPLAAELLLAPGERDVVVATPTPGGGTSASAVLRVVPACTPIALVDETCDGFDDDCDDGVDDDFRTQRTSCGDPAAPTFGATRCEAGVIVDTCTPGQVEPVVAATEIVSPDEGGRISVPDDGAEVVVPPGAVETEVPITVTRTVEPPPPDVVPMGPAYDLDPDGLVFSTPILVAVPFAGDPRRVRLVLTSDGVDEELPTMTAEGLAMAWVPHFSTIRPVAATGCPPVLLGDDALCNGVDDDCDGDVDEDFVPSATTCGSGACTGSGVTTCTAGQVVDSCIAPVPAPCDDGDACTIDSSLGVGAGCVAMCSFAPVACVDGDGCCRVGCGWMDDSDCPQDPSFVIERVTSTPLPNATLLATNVQGQVLYQEDAQTVRFWDLGPTSTLPARFEVHALGDGGHVAGRLGTTYALSIWHNGAIVRTAPPELDDGNNMTFVCDMNVAGDAVVFAMWTGLWLWDQHGVATNILAPWELTPDQRDWFAVNCNMPGPTERRARMIDDLGQVTSSVWMSGLPPIPQIWSAGAWSPLPGQPIAASPNGDRLLLTPSNQLLLWQNGAVTRTLPALPVAWTTITTSMNSLGRGGHVALDAWTGSPGASDRRSFWWDGQAWHELTPITPVGRTEVTAVAPQGFVIGGASPASASVVAAADSANTSAPAGLRSNPVVVWHRGEPRTICDEAAAPTLVDAPGQAVLRTSWLGDFVVQGADGHIRRYGAWPAPITSCSSLCGNGVVDAGEQCDDGNHVEGDGCSWNCTPTFCGNGIVEGSEQCDDGDLSDPRMDRSFTIWGGTCDRECLLDDLTTPGYTETLVGANPARTSGLRGLSHRGDVLFTEATQANPATFVHSNGASQPLPMNYDVLFFGDEGQVVAYHNAQDLVIWRDGVVERSFDMAAYTQIDWVWGSTFFVCDMNAAGDVLLYSGWDRFAIWDRNNQITNIDPNPAGLDISLMVGACNNFMEAIHPRMIDPQGRVTFNPYAPDPQVGLAWMWDHGVWTQLPGVVFGMDAEGNRLLLGATPTARWSVWRASDRVVARTIVPPTVPVSVPRDVRLLDHDLVLQGTERPLYYDNGVWRSLASITPAGRSVALATTTSGDVLGVSTRVSAATWLAADPLHAAGRPEARLPNPVVLWRGRDVRELGGAPVLASDVSTPGQLNATFERTVRVAPSGHVAVLGADLRIRLYTPIESGLADVVMTCGNGRVDPGETCDDGNGTDGDACNHDCRPSFCGNGVVEAGEVCDDGDFTDPRLDATGCAWGGTCTADCAQTVVLTPSPTCRR
ncbi:DUF4215 domain-containing protein [Myxococcota bacterium]|nr:DUF4215 domain-containing protein [Myxococcota bacterium]